MSVLYNRLMELCEAQGITGYRLCKDSGVSPGVMTDLKAGRKKTVSAETAQKFADRLGVTVGVLLGVEDIKKDPALSDEVYVNLQKHAKVAVIIEKMQALSPENMEKALEFIEFLAAKEGDGK